MRRRITGALLTFILLTVLLLLQLPAAGAEKIPASRCSHSNKSLMRSQDPTCTEAGYMYNVCQDCGSDFTETIPAKGHSPVTVPGRAATCTSAGLTEGSQCSVCGAVLARQTEIPATGHHPKSIAGRAATCTSGGRTEGSQCSVCGEVLVQQTDIPALGHAWDGGKLTLVPECTKEGIMTYTCTRCHEKRMESVPPNGHSGEAIPEKKATCTEAGSKGGMRCRICGAIIEKPKTVPAKGHKEKKTKGKSATCTEAGLTNGSVCSVCGTVIKKQETIPAKGHTPTVVQGRAATCTAAGLTEGSKCSVCSTVLKKQEQIPALGHIWDEGTVTKEAGYLEPGETLYTCQRDRNHTKTEEIPAKVPDDQRSISLFMGSVRGNPPADPDAFPGDKLTIEKQPEGGQIPEGGSLELTVEVSGGVKPYHYSWHKVYEIKGEKIYTSVGGDAPGCPVTESGDYYCFVTDSLEQFAISDTVSVSSQLRIIQEPKSVNLKTGGTMTCLAEGGVPPYSYQWCYYLGNDSTSELPGAPDSNTLDPVQLNVPEGTSLVCKVTDEAKNETWSDPATVYSAEPLSVDCTPMLYLRKGELAEFGAWPHGGLEPYTVTWRRGITPCETEKRPDGGYYTTEISYGGYASFTCEVTDEAGETVSCATGYDYKQLTITQQPQGGKLPHGGGEHILTIAVEGGQEPYTFLLNNPSGDNQVSNGTGGTCSFTVTEPEWYDIYVEDAEGNYAYSDFAIVTGYDTVQITDYTSDAYIMKPKGGATLSVTVEGGKAPYSYDWKLEQHGPYDPGLFSACNLKNSPSITVYEPGSVYSCTVTDAYGDTAYAWGMRVYYAGGIWILEQPQDVELSVQANGQYSFSMDCKAISVSDGLNYQWFVCSKEAKKSYPVTIERGPYGGQHYERTGVAKQVGGKYYCKITDPLSGEQVSTRSASVRIPMSLVSIEQNDLDENRATFAITVAGGVPPYTVYAMGADGRSVALEENDPFSTTAIVESVSPYSCTLRTRYASHISSKTGEYVYSPCRYAFHIYDSMGQKCVQSYTCTPSSKGVPAKVTFGH